MATRVELKHPHSYANSGSVQLLYMPHRHSRDDNISDTVAREGGDGVALRRTWDALYTLSPRLDFSASAPSTGVTTRNEDYSLYLPLHIFSLPIILL